MVGQPEEIGYRQWREVELMKLAFKGRTQLM